MSWINSNATYKQNSKNDLSFYHGFSKTPVEPNTSNGSAVTTLANATTKSGHTVSATEVWASEIPWFGLVPSKAVAVTRLSGITKKNDLVRVNGDKDYIYIGQGNEIFTEATWSTYWSPITLTNGMVLKNAAGDDVLRYYEKQQMQALEPNNNAGIDSKGYATRLFVNEDTHTAVTTVGQGSVISQFAAGTDNIKNGIASSELNPVLYLNDTQKIAGTHYYDYNVSGTILWNANVKSSTPKITCFHYIGKTVTQQVGEISSTVAAHTNEISEIKDKLGLGDTGTEGTPSLGGRVTDNEAALRVLLGLEEGAKVVATESISTSISAAEGRVKETTDALAGRIAQLEGITHFSVVVVPDGQTIENVTPLAENTIYLVKDANAAEGTYIEYIAYKPTGSETVVTEKIGSTAIDLSGYTTDAEHTALVNRVTTIETTTIPAAITTAQGYTDTKIADELKDGGSIATAIATAKQAAIDSAKVTLTAGTGITIPNSGTPQTAFTINVDTSVIATKDSVDELSELVSGVSQTVASNKTEIDGKISAIEGQLSATGTTGEAIKAAQDAADAAQETANQAKTTADSAVQSVARASGSSTLLTVTQDGTDVTVELDSTVATKSDITTEINKLSAEGGAITGLTTRVTTIETSLADGGTIHELIDAAQATADAKVASVTGPTSGLVTVSGDKEVTITVSDTIATKDYVATAASTAITTSLAGTTAGTIGYAIADAKKAGTDAATTAAANLATARGEITTEIATAVSGLETKLTTGDGSLGAKVAALETVTGTTLPAAIEQALTDAKAYSDSLHTTSLDYVVLGDSESLPTASADTLGKIYLVASQNAPTADGAAISGAYVEYMTRKVSDTQYTWEKIGTTAADLNAYAKKSELAVASTTANGLTYSQTDGVVSASVTKASTTQIGTVQLTDTYTSTDDTNAATGKSIAAAIDTLDSTKSVNGITVTQENGIITSVTEELITASVPEGTTSVEGNIAYVGSTKHVIAPEKFETATQMPATLTSWVADLSNLTVGDEMFYGGNLETFIGDLSSLTSGVDMFLGCTLDEKSWEVISDTLPIVEGEHVIHMGGYTQYTWTAFKVDCLEIIQNKGWVCQYELGGVFD